MYFLNFFFGVKKEAKKPPKGERVMKSLSPFGIPHS